MKTFEKLCEIENQIEQNEDIQNIKSALRSIGHTRESWLKQQKKNNGQ